MEVTEVVPSEKAWEFSNFFHDCNMFGNSDMFNNTAPEFVEDCSIEDFDCEQQLFLVEPMVPSFHVSTFESLHEHAIPSHSAGAQADPGNDMLYLDDLQHDLGNDMLFLDDLQQVQWELPWLPTMETMPEFPPHNQSGQMEEWEHQDGRGPEVQEPVLQNGGGPGVQEWGLEDGGGLGDDQPGQIEESALKDGGDGRYGQSGQEKRDGACSDELVQAPPTAVSPRPVLPHGKGIGVTYHKKNKQWEAHLWMRGHQLRGRKKKGVQIFLGNFDTEAAAKRAHDRAAIKLEVRTTARGKPYPLNFPEAEQAEYMANHSNWTLRDFLWKIRRSSTKFSKGKSSMKGVSMRRRSMKRGQAVTLYEAKLSQTVNESGEDMKRTYILGYFASEVEAGEAYDRALLFLHSHLPEVEQLSCITNFRPSNYSVADIEASRSKLLQ